MRVLVIGGAGYIGSHVALELLEQGYQVTVFDNLSSGDRLNLHQNSQFIHGSILDPIALRHAMADHQAVIHLAAYKAAGESMLDPGKYAWNNIAGTINILNAMLESKISLLVFSSSAAVYGEPQYLPLDEKHQTIPENFYGQTKLEIEKLLEWYQKLKGLRWAALRYFNAAGYDNQLRVKGLEQNPANLLPVIMEVAVGKRPFLGVFGQDYPTRDGTCIRDYIHVTDLARAHVKSLELLNKKEKILVNLGSENGVTVLEMLETARRITQKAIPSQIQDRRPGDPTSLIASSSLARELLGWKAEFSSVENLIESTWNVYRYHFKT